MKRLLLLFGGVVSACGGPGGPSPPRPVAAGRWVSEPTEIVGSTGKAQMVLEVESGGVRFRDTAACAFGEVRLPLTMDEFGVFETAGTITPAFLGTRTVRLRGRVEGTRMTLDVQDEQGRAVLVFGRSVVLFLGRAVVPALVIC